MRRAMTIHAGNETRNATTRSLFRFGVALKFCTAAVLLLAMLSGPSHLPAAPRVQAERILNYHSDIEIHDDGTMLVTESIRVVCLGNRIRHGIYRDFPTTYTDQLGRRYTVGFTLFGATRDAEPEQTRIVDQANGKRIYLGAASALVPPGEHIYTITYSTNRQLGFFQDHDELFWNVTGNGWILPIEKASATVQLPSKIPTDSVQLNGYTGRQGATEKSLTCESRADGTFAFQATRPLNSFEGLTILLTWPKGFIAEPTQQQKFAYFVLDNREMVVGAFGFALILVYYIVAWWAVGRDPKGGPIVVSYDAPSNLSPAGIRYLVKMGYDNKAFTSAVLNMAVKGYLTIKQEAGSYTLIRATASDSVLSADERLAASILLGGRSEIWLHNENHTVVSGAMNALKASLKVAEQKIYFVTNSAYMIPAVVLTAPVLIVVVSSNGGPMMLSVGFICLWLSIWTIALAGMLRGVGQMWKSAVSGGPERAPLIAKAATMSAFVVPFLGGEAMGFFFLSKVTSFSAVLVFIAIAALHIVFHQLLKAPTRLGRDMLDRIEGFKRFLGAVEGDPMNRANPPSKTPEVFEKFLPYALALDVEQAWAEKFSGVLGAAGQAPAGNGAYCPAWYSGSSWNGMGVTGFAGAMSGAFSSAISSSAAAPGSSAGGGGGSGGGGGGGGGGGW